eukprot:Gb_26582 [translate_table: standard]
MSSGDLAPDSSPPVWQIPPSQPSGEDYSFSPIVIAVIGALGGVFLILIYYKLFIKYCSAFERLTRRNESQRLTEATVNEASWQVSNRGLDPSIISRIPVFHYNTRDGTFVPGIECSVCLSEFDEGELVRLLPKCRHAFHIGCIDMWFGSHSNCPLCRADVVDFFSTVNDILTSTPHDMEVMDREEYIHGIHYGYENGSAGTSMERACDDEGRTVDGTEATKVQCVPEYRRFHSSASSAQLINTIHHSSLLRRSFTIGSFSENNTPAFAPHRITDDIGTSSSQWQRHFKWNKRVLTSSSSSSSSSNEEIRSRLLHKGPSSSSMVESLNDPHEILVDVVGSSGEPVTIVDSKLMGSVPNSCLPTNAKGDEMEDRMKCVATEDDDSSGLKRSSSMGREFACTYLQNSHLHEVP